MYPYRYPYGNANKHYFLVDRLGKSTFFKIYLLLQIKKFNADLSFSSNPSPAAKQEQFAQSGGLFLFFRQLTSTPALRIIDSENHGNGRERRHGPASKMTGEELHRFRAFSLADYAEDRIRGQDRSREQALSTRWTGSRKPPAAAAARSASGNTIRVEKVCTKHAAVCLPNRRKAESA